MRSRRFMLVRAGAVAASALFLAVPLLAPFAGASSHREAPLIADDPTVDNTDVYAFVSPDDPSKVTLISNWIPFEEPAGGPNFFHFADNARYLIKIDRDGDAVEDITYEWTFRREIRNPNTFLYNTGPITSPDDPDYNFRQHYTIKKIVRGGSTTTLFENDLMVPDNIGPRSEPDYTKLAAESVGSQAGYKEFTGQRDDPFFVDVGSIFDLLGLRPFNPAHVIPLAAAPGVDTTGGFNIHTTAIQVLISELAPEGCDLKAADAARNKACVVGIWSTSERRRTTVLRPGTEQAQGDFVQVSRLGSPLVNEVVIPLGQKDLFNGTPPSGDARFASRVLNPEVPRLYCVLYGISSPGVTCNNHTPSGEAQRTDLVQVFLTGIPGLTEQQKSAEHPSEQLRLNLAVKPTAGVCKGNVLGVVGGDLAGFPNGRRLEDDVTDIELRALAGGYALTPDFDKAPNNKLGDGVNANDQACLEHFPYMATPWQGYDHQHHKTGSTSTP